MEIKPLGLSWFLTVHKSQSDYEISIAGIFVGERGDSGIGSSAASAVLRKSKDGRRGGGKPRPYTIFNIERYDAAQHQLVMKNKQYITVYKKLRMYRKISACKRKISDSKRKTSDSKRKTSDNKRKTSDNKRKTSDNKRKTSDNKRKTSEHVRKTSKCVEENELLYLDYFASLRNCCEIN
jgi:hypothetical protein